MKGSVTLQMGRDFARRERLREIFQDTQEFYTSDPVLSEAVETGKTKTIFYPADDYPELTAISGIGKKLGLTLAINSRSFQAAMKFHRAMPEKKIAVLNFASSTTPGGGVFGGSGAQEESLCRCSTLYPLISQDWLWDSYYAPNRAARDFRNNDACIYSEDVVICKSDTDYPERLPREDFAKVDVITCAAPNMKYAPMNFEISESFDLHYNRARHILHVASLHGVDIMISGAFGCGAFRNNPDIVSQAWSKALEQYQKNFEYIIFAIYFRDYETPNFQIFSKRFNN